MYDTIRNNLKRLGILGASFKYALPSKESAVSITREIGGVALGKRSALAGDFSADDRLKMSVRIPRRAGLCSVRLVICEDGGENSVYPFTLELSDLTRDTFNLSLAVSELPSGLSVGLYYYHLELSFGSLTLYTDTPNNADITLSESYPQCRTRILIYDKDFETPDWFCGNIMYHIFVDRFCKGTKMVPVSPTAVMDPDWDNGIPQYGEYPGAFVENNVFFGGTLYGVCEKLEYLAGLGVGCIYLSPIFKAYSNHKYDTGDYMTVDEMFGSEKALEMLLERAKSLGIEIILDGVFNHTGDDSLYFNRYGRYDSLGAYGNENSPYRDWYCFEEGGGYKSWWGIEILPKLNLANPKCEDFFLGCGGVLEKYLDMGIGGVRLDVADELPQSFLERLRRTVKGKRRDGLIIGEVWENAADKIAYGERRRYFRGGMLDSVMNYPQKNAVIELVKNGDFEFFYNTLTELYSSYPKQCSDVLMNILGTHDTDRILTVLGGESPDGLSNDELSVKRMTRKERGIAVKRLKVASVLQYTLFGVPSVFYGDEVGLEGYHDPFCRLPFPWGREDGELLSHYARLGKIRRGEKVFEKGDFEFVRADNGVVVYRRYDESGEILVAANASEKPCGVQLLGEYENLMTDTRVRDAIRLPAMSAAILKKTALKEGETQ